MIIEYDNSGRIIHMIYDPVDPTIVDFYTSEDFEGNVLNLEPIPWPPTQDIDIDTGLPVVEIIDEEEIPVMSSKGKDYAKVDMTGQYIKDGAVTRRPTFNLPEMTAAEVGDTLRFDDLPLGTVIFLDDERHELSENQLTLECDMAADYTIKFVCWPYMDAAVKVTVNEAQP